MSKDLNQYLDKLPMESFEQIVSNRRATIEAADAKFPEYSYNANVVAAALHPKKQYVIIKEIEERVDAKSYQLVPDEDRGTTALAYFNAGQYISVELRIGDSVLTRPYTIASPPSDALSGSYTLTIKRTEEGFASDYVLEHWQVGTKLTISAPKGDFFYEPLRDARHVLANAGGSGITPFISMLNAINDKIEDFYITFFMGAEEKKPSYTARI